MFEKETFQYTVHAEKLATTSLLLNDVTALQKYAL